MSQQPDNALAALAANPANLMFGRGIEREGLRVDPQGNLSRATHPAPLGSKLTHPMITTDFSEAQLELITPVQTSIEGMLAQLTEIHQIAHRSLGDEVLWAASMPCVLAGDNNIPLAQYGTSNLGRLKTTYRNGLGHRYGKSMQTICAVHFNFSFSDSFWQTLADFEGADNNKMWRSARYFDLVRNFRRLSWLPLYLFGASPAVCNSFVRGRQHNLERFDEGSLYARGATSLRSGSLGYQSDTQGHQLHVCYNSLDEYVSTLAQAICTPQPDYETIGLISGHEHLQVNANILQSEAEFYSTIRAKRVPPKGANFLKVLRDQGVEYIEVRLLDLNPYLPLGIDSSDIHFLDMLLLHCLLTHSPALSDDECAATAANDQQVVYGGRDADTRLDDNGTPRAVADWGLDAIHAMAPIAATLDAAHGGNDYAASLRAQQDKLEDPGVTPSARVLADMKAQSIPFFRFAMNESIAHQQYLRGLPLAEERIAYYQELAEQSVIDQQKIEAADVISFDRYLAALNAEYRDLLP